MILALGVDLVEVARFERAVARQGTGFLRGFLRPSEIRHCAVSPHPPSSHALAFAGKEALFKALGTGRAGPVSWQDVALPVERDGVLRLGFDRERQSGGGFDLCGGALEALERMGVRRIHLSRSLCRGVSSRLATALVVLEGDGPEGHE